MADQGDFYKGFYGYSGARRAVEEKSTNRRLVGVIPQHTLTHSLISFISPCIRDIRRIFSFSLSLSLSLCLSVFLSFSLYLCVALCVSLSISLSPALSFSLYLPFCFYRSLGRWLYLSLLFYFSRFDHLVRAYFYRSVNHASSITLF